MAGKTTSTKKTTTRRATSAKATTARRESPSSPKQAKPIFRTGTWVTILILAAVIGLSIYLNREKKPGETDGTPVSAPPSPLFSTSEGDPTSIEVKPTDGESVKIARNADKAWEIELPTKTEADQGLAEAAATQITALKLNTPIDGDPGIFGLDKPAYVITIEFAGGKKHTLEIGDNTPTNNGYYVRIDRDKMVITDLSGIDALLQLATFPPYLNTPTPSALPPTETPVPTTQAAPAPEASATPTP